MREALFRKWMDAFVAYDWDTVKGKYADDTTFFRSNDWCGVTVNGVEENLESTYKYLYDINGKLTKTVQYNKLGEKENEWDE